MIPGRSREVKLVCVLSGLLAAALIAAGSAAAREAYVTNSGDGTVSVLDTVTNSGVATIPVGAEPVDVAITPNGTRAYVVNQADGTVSVIDTGSNAVVGGPIAVGSEPRGVAITPDGGHAYVSNFGDGTVSVIDTASNTVVGAPIPVGAEPDGVAVSPDGHLAFVAQGSGNVAAIDTSTNAVVGSVPDAQKPSRISIGPHGGRAFVTNKLNSVTVFNPATASIIGAPIAVGQEPAGIAVAPSGGSAYVTSPKEGTLMQIDTSLDSVVGAPISGFPGATGIAFEPRGQRALVTDGGGSGVTLLDATRNVAAGSIGTGKDPAGVAVVPDQGPRASFWVSPVPSTLRRARRRLTFHGSGSSDPDGKIVDYAWNFGDGGHAEGTSPTRVHKYGRPGTYLATLVVTDDEGCSTEPSFTGQTASCTGSPVASVTVPITVLEEKGPVLHFAGPKTQRLRGRVTLRAECPRVPCAVAAGGVAVTAIESGGAVHRSQHRLGRVAASLSAGVWRRLSLRVPVRARGSARRVLRSGGEAVAKLSVVATDQTGSQTEETRKVKLVLP